VGKTLTAEAIAEYTHKPLYPINLGEVTSDVRVVSNLETHFSRASQWGALLLLDEADVLLEKRSFEDMSRNAVVSGNVEPQFPRKDDALANLR
jgi:AAA+ superfamily predicted ATPase